MVATPNEYEIHRCPDSLKRLAQLIALGGIESGATLARENMMDTVRRAIQRASALTASDLKKGVSALATIGSTAPFVGLFGTVLGVINAFQGIGNHG